MARERLRGELAARQRHVGDEAGAQIVPAESAAELAGCLVAVAAGNTQAGEVYLLPIPSSALNLGVTNLVFVLSNLVANAPQALAVKTANYVVQATDKIIEVGSVAAPLAGNVVITVPLALGSAASVKQFRIIKADTTNFAVQISADGVTIIDQILTPASANGQIGGFRDVYSNGTALRSFGAG